MTVGTLATLTAVGKATATSGAASTGQSCGVITVKGHECSVYATNVKCSVAKKWAPAMAAKKVPKNQIVQMKGGPKGSRAPDTRGSKPVDARVRPCGKGLAGPHFNWVIFTTSSS
ncbi:MAG TPA: hypothetical protein VNG12_04630 [Acidimicrobiales bacterium]|nr:hypothetical protein [Acidimicrobiales bacterium]